MRGYARGFLFASVLSGISLLHGAASAQEGADFYKGKTVTYIVSTAAGGAYDIYGRLVAEFMQKYLPGSTFVVKNLPGAGHLVGANTLYASKPDGLTIGTFNTGLIYSQLVGAENVRLDLSKMSWIGKAASDPRAITVKADLPIHSLKDLQDYKGQINFSAGGVGSAAYVELTILTKALKLPTKILTGYNGLDDQLAMRRGEVQGSIAARSSWEGVVKNGYGRFIVQIGGSQTDLPQLSTQVTDPSVKALVALVQSQGDLSRLTAGPPGIPEDRLAVLRDAYRKALQDPEFRAKAEKAELPVDPAFGEDVAKKVRAALNQTPETIALLKEVVQTKESK